MCKIVELCKIRVPRKSGGHTRTRLFDRHKEKLLQIMFPFGNDVRTRAVLWISAIRLPFGLCPLLSSAAPPLVPCAILSDINVWLPIRTQNCKPPSSCAAPAAPRWNWFIVRWLEGCANPSRGPHSTHLHSELSDFVRRGNNVLSGQRMRRSGVFPFSLLYIERQLRSSFFALAHRAYSSIRVSLIRVHGM
jgi:hypothetical protein